MALTKGDIKAIGEILQLNNQNIMTNVSGLVTEQMARARAVNAQDTSCATGQSTTGTESKPIEPIHALPKIYKTLDEIPDQDQDKYTDTGSFYLLKRKYRTQEKTATQTTRTQEKIAISAGNKGKKGTEKRPLVSNVDLPASTVPESNATVIKRKRKATEPVVGINIADLVDESNQRADVVDGILSDLATLEYGDVYATKEVGTRRGYQAVVALTISRLLNNPGILGKIAKNNPVLG